jgi:hypothetical protein
MVNHSDVIAVRLLKDVKGFGRRGNLTPLIEQLSEFIGLIQDPNPGSIVPIPRGMFRNQWLPARKAEYIPQTQLHTLKLQGLSVERDFNFGMVDPSVLDATRNNKDTLKTIRAGIKPIKIQHLTPERTSELLNIFLPPTLTFARPIIGPPASTSSESAALTPIYGSLTSSDIASQIREALAHNPEASRVSPADLDIKFVIPERHKQAVKAVGVDENAPEASTAERLKHIGDFEVELRIRTSKNQQSDTGKDLSIVRSVKVLPEVASH